MGELIKVGDEVFHHWNTNRIGTVIVIKNGIVTVEWKDTKFKARYYDFDLQLVK